MPLVITSLKGRHTDTHKLTDKAILRNQACTAWFKKGYNIVTNVSKVCLLVNWYSYKRILALMYILEMYQ